MATLPASAHPHLKQKLDYDHNGVDTDLIEIANYMVDWEVKLSAPFELTEEDVKDIKHEYKDKPALQR